VTPLETFYKRCVDGLTREKRLAVLLSAIALCLHFVQIKFEKVSVGGSEIVISEPYVVNGLLGLVIIYLTLSLLRRMIGAQWAQKILDPAWQVLLTREDPVFANFRRVDNAVTIFECALIGLAIITCLPDTIQLMVVAGLRASAQIIGVFR